MHGVQVYTMISRSMTMGPTSPCSVSVVVKYLLNARQV